MSNKIDFLPEDYIEKKAQQRTNVICLVLFLLVTAGVGGGFAVTEQRQREIDKRSTKINREMLQVSESLKQLDMLKKQRKEMMHKASISASLMEPVPRSLLLATMTNDLPTGVSLLKYDIKSKDLAEKNRKKGRKSRSRNKKSKMKNKTKGKNNDKDKKIDPRKWETSIELTGLAPTDIQVAKFIRRLNDSPLFSHVNLVFSEEHEMSEELLRHFKLAVMLDPDVRASEEEVVLARKTNVKGM